MRSLFRAVHEGMESMAPLPAPFYLWGKNEALLYRSAVTVLAGPPGCGKTITALNIVNNLRVPTLYVSNDSNRYTVAKRTYSMITGTDASVSAEIVETRPDLAGKVLTDWDNVRFNFSSSPSVEEIVRHGEAFREAYGEYPPLTVVDILMKVDHPGVAEQIYWNLFSALVDVAKEQNTAILGVHHTSEGAKCNPCPPKSSVMGKANQLPELIVTQVMREEKILYAIVKNRNGSSDETGETFFSIPVNAGQCKIEDVDPDEGLTFRDGPTVPKNMKINPQAEKVEDF